MREQAKKTLQDIDTLFQSPSNAHFFKDDDFYFVTYSMLYKEKKENRINSIVLFHRFSSIHERKKRENWLNKIIEMYISLFTTMNGIELSIVLLIFFQLHYREKRKEKKKLLTSYDFGSSMKIDWNKTIIEHICISFDRLYSMDIFRWE